MSRIPSERNSEIAGARYPISPNNERIQIGRTIYIKFTSYSTGSIYECDECGGRTVDLYINPHEMTFFHLASCSSHSSRPSILNNRELEETNYFSQRYIQNRDNLDNRTRTTLNNIEDDEDNVSDRLQSMRRMIHQTLNLLENSFPQNYNISNSLNSSSPSPSLDISEMIPPPYSEADPDLPPYIPDI